jgi:hypothetical protein
VSPGNGTRRFCSCIFLSVAIACMMSGTDQAPWPFTPSRVLRVENPGPIIPSVSNGQLTSEKIRRARSRDVLEGAREALKTGFFLEAPIRPCHYGLE